MRPSFESRMGIGLSSGFSKIDVTLMFLAAVRSTISRYAMTQPGETVVVGVSGGADSVALLHALWSLRQELQTDLVVAHLNHGIRGEDSDRDAEFVRGLAARLDVPSVVEKVDLPGLRKQMRLGMEEVARKVRYDFLERIATSAQAARIAVAHTADDQVETVLLNIIRGAGPEGLRGMPAVRGKIIRPLIDLFRSDVEAYLRENDLKWRTDATNLDPAYARNRVRLELIPFLEEKFNPRIRDVLLSLSRLAAEEAEVVRAEAEKAFESAVKEAGRESVAFDAAVLRGSERALVRRCLRMAIETVKGDLRDVEYGQVERIVGKLESGEDFGLTLPSGRVYASLARGRLLIYRRTDARRVEVRRKLAVPGRTEVPELSIAIETRLVPKTARPLLPSQAVVDSSKLSGPLVVRTWKPGDRMVPLGMAGHKKLQDLFTDRKVPREERGRIPIVADDEKIVWVVGVATSELVKVTDKTDAALWLECLPFGEQLS
jgi:tRNA(Ile)-lysidine synthase